MILPQISIIEKYIPELKVTHQDLVDELSYDGFTFDPRIITTLIGDFVRYKAMPNEQVSDMAVSAAQKVLKRVDKSTIDLLIFASASADLIEPATSNIIQHKLQVFCPCFDIKNACNSVAVAIDVASSMINSGMHQRILIVSGEKPSDSINKKGLNKENLSDRIASFSFGDAGIALLMENGEEDSTGIFYQKNTSHGEFWDLCQIPGGGSLFPDDESKLFFQGKTYELKSVIDRVGPPFVKRCFEEAGIEVNDIDFICSHQVSKNTAQSIADHLSIDVAKVVDTFALYGNTASTSMPIAYCDVLEKNLVKKGDIVLLLGMAAGVNISVQLIRQ